jgi:hypothetical protein
MKRLFVINNENDLDLNKEWLHLIPEFSIILHRVWKVEGDSDGRKKYMQRRIFGYIYFMYDLSSPIYTWKEERRKEEALLRVNLKPADVEEEKVRIAVETYKYLQYESIPALKALDAMYASLSSMNEYLTTIDLNEVDKQGKPKHTPASITRAIKDMNAAYDAVATMERRIMEKMKEEGGNTIRGTATLGGKEGKRNKEWKEGEGPTKTEIQKSVENAIETGQTLASFEPQADFRKMGAMIRAYTSEGEEADT